MSDLISRQLAIVYACSGSVRRMDDGDWRRVEDIKRDLMTMPSAQPEQHWIPTSKKLPEETGLYLTTTMYGDVYCDYWNGLNFDRTEYVIAWKPMPEPYKGGE